MFAALAENFGDMKSKINLFVALCPITNLGQATNGFLVNSGSQNNYYYLEKTLKAYDIH
jgi:hypothetical protein